MADEEMTLSVADEAITGEAVPEEAVLLADLVFTDA